MPGEGLASGVSGDGNIVVGWTPSGASTWVWRNGLEVFHLPASAPYVRALKWVRTGRPLAEVCAAYGTTPEAASAIPSSKSPSLPRP